LRLLFFMRHPGYGRIFESALAELARRGHEINVVLDSTRAAWLGGFNPLDPLAARFPNLTYSAAPRAPRGGSLALARGLRASLDYLRYLEDDYHDAPKLRARASSKVPRFIRSFPGVRFRPIRGMLAAFLRFCERSLSPRPDLKEFIAERRPEAVLVTPLVAMGSTQVDYVRAARELGIPTALCVTSWDNLTNKGLMHEIPDLVTVWNEPQLREAVELHGVPEERVEVTGAQCYDHWFEYEPSGNREEFCRLVGLPPDKPIILYLCSSRFIAPKEVPFVRDWIDALRTSGEPLSEAGVLVRPHPQHFAQWQDVDLGPRAVVWPPSGADPVTRDAKQGFFDSMYHCSAVVGINTSAQIESAIVGKVVHTVLADDFRETQHGTLHFEHIAGESGMLRIASSLDEHVGQLATTIGTSATDERTRAFVQYFVRPRGLDAPATPVFVDAIEQLPERPPARFRRPFGASVVSALLAPAAKRAERKSRKSKETPEERGALAPAEQPASEKAARKRRRPKSKMGVAMGGKAPAKGTKKGKKKKKRPKGAKRADADVARG
jgi:hypothetical protein